MKEDIRVKMRKVNGLADELNEANRRFRDSTRSKPSSKSKRYGSLKKKLAEKSLSPKKRVINRKTRTLDSSLSKRKNSEYKIMEEDRLKHGVDRYQLKQEAKGTKRGSLIKRLAKAKPQEEIDIRKTRSYNRKKLAEREYIGKSKRASGKERMITRRERSQLKEMLKRKRSKDRIRRQTAVPFKFSSGGRGIPSVNKDK